MSRFVDITVPDGMDAAVFPIGDIHYAGGGRHDHCSIKKLIYFLDWTVERFQGCYRYYVGIGDYIDPLSGSNREALSQARLYKTPRKLIDERIAKPLTEELAEILSPYVDTDDTEMVTVLAGNHKMDYTEDGMIKSTDGYLAELLGSVAHPTPMAHIDFHIGEEKRTLIAEHGAAAATILTSPLSKMQKVIAPFTDADIAFRGHSHHLVAGVLSRLERDGKEYKQRPLHLLGCGSFLKSYDPDEPSYPEEKEYAPAAIGSGGVRIRQDGGIETTMLT